MYCKPIQLLRNVMSSARTQNVGLLFIHYVEQTLGTTVIQSVSQERRVWMVQCGYDAVQAICTL